MIEIAGEDGTGPQEGVRDDRGRGCVGALASVNFSGFYVLDALHLLAKEEYLITPISN